MGGGKCWDERSVGSEEGKRRREEKWEEAVGRCSGRRSGSSSRSGRRVAEGCS